MVDFADRYLDTALRLELSSKPHFASSNRRRTDAGVNASRLASRDGQRDTTRRRRRVSDHGCRPRRAHSGVRQSEPVSDVLPGDLAAAAGRLFRRLAVEGLARVARDDSQRPGPAATRGLIDPRHLPRAYSAYQVRPAAVVTAVVLFAVVIGIAVRLKSPAGALPAQAPTAGSAPVEGAAAAVPVSLETPSRAAAIQAPAGQSGRRLIRFPLRSWSPAMPTTLPGSLRKSWRRAVPRLCRRSSPRFRNRASRSTARMTRWPWRRRDRTRACPSSPGRCGRCSG